MDPEPNRSTPRAILLALPMLTWAILMAMPTLLQGSRDGLIAAMATTVFMVTLFFLMMKTGRTHRYRRIFFVTLGFLFPVGFIYNLIHLRGSMGLPLETLVSGETPFCHIAIPMVLLPAALKQTLIFPGSILPSAANPHAAAPMVALWLAATLVLGRGFCSVGCFFGGLDEGFSSCMKRPRLARIPAHWTWLPWAVLAFVVVGSLLTFSPIYCEWLCPFKAVTEFAEPNSLQRILQTVIFGSLFATLVIVLPILTRKRTQCALFCPLGALQSLGNRVNVFDIRIDRTTCTDCMACEKACPTLSLTRDSVRAGQTLPSCTKCGACVDTCRSGAAVWHVKGTVPGRFQGFARVMYLYSAWGFATMFGGSILTGSLISILRMIH